MAGRIVYRQYADHLFLSVPWDHKVTDKLVLRQYNKLKKKLLTIPLTNHVIECPANNFHYQLVIQTKAGFENKPTSCSNHFLWGWNQNDLQYQLRSETVWLTCCSNHSLVLPFHQVPEVHRCFFILFNQPASAQIVFVYEIHFFSPQKFIFPVFFPLFH